jgi:hypothetical protein
VSRITFHGTGNQDVIPRSRIIIHRPETASQPGNKNNKNMLALSIPSCVEYGGHRRQPSVIHQNSRITLARVLILPVQLPWFQLSNCPPHCSLN